MAGGILYLGGGTPIQEACGFTDTPDDMFAYLVAACGPGVDEAKARIYCDENVAHYHWLVEHGVPFKAEFFPEHDREPPTDAGLIFSGGEDAAPYDRIAVPAPRGHHPQYPDAAGGFLMERLLAAVDATAPPCAPTARVDRLVVDGDAGGGRRGPRGRQRASGPRSAGCGADRGRLHLQPADAPPPLPAGHPVPGAGRHRQRRRVRHPHGDGRRRCDPCDGRGRVCPADHAAQDAGPRDPGRRRGRAVPQRGHLHRSHRPARAVRGRGSGLLAGRRGAARGDRRPERGGHASRVGGRDRRGAGRRDRRPAGRAGPHGRAVQRLRRRRC